MPSSVSGQLEQSHLPILPPYAPSFQEGSNSVVRQDSSKLYQGGDSADLSFDFIPAFTEADEADPGESGSGEGSSGESGSGESGSGESGSGEGSSGEGSSGESGSGESGSGESGSGEGSSGESGSGESGSGESGSGGGGSGSGSTGGIGGTRGGGGWGTRPPSFSREVSAYQQELADLTNQSGLGNIIIDGGINGCSFSIFPEFVAITFLSELSKSGFRGLFFNWEWLDEWWEANLKNFNISGRNSLKHFKIWERSFGRFSAWKSPLKDGNRHEIFFGVDGVSLLSLPLSPANWALNSPTNSNYAFVDDIIALDLSFLPKAFFNLFGTLAKPLLKTSSHLFPASNYTPIFLNSSCNLGAFLHSQKIWLFPEIKLLSENYNPLLQNAGRPVTRLIYLTYYTLIFVSGYKTQSWKTGVFVYPRYGITSASNLGHYSEAILAIGSLAFAITIATPPLLIAARQGEKLKGISGTLQ